MAPRKKALVLSGGGGRGAYHVGVIEALIEHGWMEDGKGPDILAGTSIGAINAAALASGMPVARLKQCWLDMHTEDVHRLSPNLPPIAQPLLRFLLRGLLTSETHNGEGGTRDMLPEPLPDAGGLLNRLGALFNTRPFNGLLDTAPWRSTLETWMDFARINGPDAPALLLTATDVQRGCLRIFCNRDRPGHARDTITIDHLMASSSIPVVYPWTEIGPDKYWDGAVVANTPLGALIDLAATDVDILVVMMTPWNEQHPAGAAPVSQSPEDLMETLALTLDWSLLASYRTAIKMLRSYNTLVEAHEKLERAAQQTGDASLRMGLPGLRRISLPTVIAPRECMPLEWIVDYEDATHRQLFAQGKADAERALQRSAAGSPTG